MAEHMPDTSSAPGPEGLLPSEPIGETAQPEPVTQGPPAAIVPVPLQADDAPTIISKRKPPPLAADEAILSLRGRRLAHFELREPIGVGGMGAVIKAYDTQLDRIVALKILPPQQAADPECLRRFQQEARAAAKLDHENIARAFFCGCDQGLHFIAFEFVDGENLRLMLERRRRIPVPEAIHYMLQVATGLAHAASRSVVHRDIKPSNIIITPTGRAKLVDMGLARSTEPQVDPLTQSGVTLGTFDYISPEQALDPSTADVRSDIYSLGCTFYHMLTGQSPAPEGTVARKLHFHEHELPIDPRQLNPQIPDELAAVLARMMAKEPKDRYQRPEHLVQHLMQLARKLGGATQLPEGMLFVDAPLLNPPRTRPVLVGTLASVLLVALVIVLGSIGGSSYQTDPFWPTSTATQRDPGPKRSGTEVKLPAPPDKQPKNQRPPAAVVAATVAELIEALKQPNVTITLTGERYELKQEDGSSNLPGLVFQGDELVLRGNSAKPPVIQLAPRLISQEDKLWAALTISARTATIRDIRFEVLARRTGTEMAAVVQRDGGTLTLENCEFIQGELPEDADYRQVRSVQVGPSSGTADADLFVNGCYFPSGDQALLISSPANVYLENCAFGPHASLCQVRGRRVQSQIALKSCSAFLPNQSAAFVLRDGASAQLLVDDSLLAAESAANPGDGAVLIRQIGEQDQLRFQSERRNVYHGLAAFWVHETTRGVKVLAQNLEEFKKAWAIGKIAADSVDLQNSPWQAKSPLELLASQPAKAFLPNLELAELRHSDNSAKLVGVQRCVWGALVAGALPEPKRSDSLARRPLIVNPQAAKSSDGIYKTLGQALEEAQPNDVILIRHNGELPVRPVMTKVSVHVTIKPDADYRPILVLGEALDRDAFLFRFHDGVLNFEDLRFHLKAGGAVFERLAILSITGEGQCSFRRCLITLEGGTLENGVLEGGMPPTVVVSLPSLSMVMPLATPLVPKEQAPQVLFKESFIRGGGDLVWIRASRSCNIDVNDSLVALEGSLLVIDPNAEPLPAKQGAKLHLDHVTAYLEQHLISLRGQNKDETRPLPGLLRTDAKAANCLLARKDDTKSLIFVRGIDSEQQLKNLFSWEEGEHNCYSNYRLLLDQSRSEGAMPLSFDRGEWERFTMIAASPRYERVRFAGWPSKLDRTLAQTLPADFRVSNPPNLLTGANVEAIDKLCRDMTATASASVDNE